MPPADRDRAARLLGPAGEFKIELLTLLADGATHGRQWYQYDDRFAELVGTVAMSDHLWVLRCIGWLRSSQALSAAAIVMAAELVRSRLRAGESDNRRFISLVLRRPDEPGALLGYWVRAYGRLIPKPVQRGVGDAVVSLYTDDTAAEFDRPGQGLGFGEVLSLARPRPTSRRQAALFRRLTKASTDASSASTELAASPAGSPATDPAAGRILREAAQTGCTPF